MRAQYRSHKQFSKPTSVSHILSGEGNGAHGAYLFHSFVDFIPFLLLMTISEQLLMTCRTPMNTGETHWTFSFRPLLPSLPRPSTRSPQPT